MLRKLFGWSGDKKHPLEEGAKKMERFTQRARHVLALSQAEAEFRHDTFIRTEYLLLALSQEEGGVAWLALRQLGLTPQMIEAAIPPTADLPAKPPAEPETALSAAEEMANQPPQNPVQLSPDIMRTLELAVDEARRVSNHFIGTENLLLALTRQEATLAFQIMNQAGLTPKKIRAHVTKNMKARS